MTSHANRILVFALSFSIVAHLAAAGLVVMFKADSRKASNTAPIETLSVSLELVESRPLNEAEPVSKPEPVTRPVPVADPEPLRKAKPVPKPKPKPESRPRVEPKPEKKSDSKKIQRQKRVASAPVKAKIKTVATQSAAESQKIDYFSLLQAHIEAHKYYPRAARKQGVEGRVEVSFQLLKNGEVRDIQSSGAHRLLKHAAARAIKEALPLPVPPDSLPMPASIQFSMHYNLKR
jgi:protein TonB